MTRARELLRAHGLAPKKSFGQNFLEDENLAARIAELATTPPGGTVLEIGAGLGALTAPLVARAGRVVAIERDRDLCPILRERFGEQVEIVEADAVKADWAALLAGPRPHVVAGNLPYQLTGRLLRRTVELADCIDRAVLMTQREVADRLSADAGAESYGALSVFVQAAFEVKRAFIVRPGAFVPQPAVDSAVTVLTPLSPPRAEETPMFRMLVQQAFAARRKQLRNAWRSVADAKVLTEAAAAAGIDLSARGETLPVEAFARMETALGKATSND